MNSGSSVPKVLAAFPNWFLGRCNDGNLGDGRQGWSEWENHTIGEH